MYYICRFNFWNIHFLEIFVVWDSKRKHTSLCVRNEEKTITNKNKYVEKQIFLISQLVILERTTDHLLAKDYSQHRSCPSAESAACIEFPRRSRDVNLSKASLGTHIKTTKGRFGLDRCQNLTSSIYSWQKFPTTFKKSFPHQNIRFNFISFSTLKPCFECNHN